MSNCIILCYFQGMEILNVPATKPNPENAKELKEVEQGIHTYAEELLSVGTPDDEIHARGQYTTLERIGQFIDEDTFCLPNTLYNPEDDAEEKIDIVPTGIVKGLGRINGKWAVTIAPDNKKMVGVWVSEQADNLLRSSDAARMPGTPLVYILNRSGIKLDEQGKVYPNRRGGDTPLYRDSELNQLSVPVTVDIYGTNLAGGGYHIISLAVLVAHEKADMAVGGAGIVGGVGSKPYVDLEGVQGMIDTTRKMKNDPLGSVSTHYNVTGFFREVYAKEFGVLDSTKKYMDYMPAFNPEFFRVDTLKAPAIRGEELYDIVPRNTCRTYDMHNVLKAPFDGDEFMEYKKDYSPEMTIDIAKVSGLPVGVATDHQSVFAIQGYPNYSEYRGKGAMGMGGKLYRQGLVKMNEFVTLCDHDHLPIIWVQDTTGIDVDDEAKKAELLGLGQNLTYSIQSTKLPMFEIMLRKGTTATHYALGGPQGNDNNVPSIGAAATKVSVMYGKIMAGTMYSRHLAKDQDSGKNPQGTISKMNRSIQYYIDTSTPVYRTKASLIDKIVNMLKIRNYVVAFADATYQNPKSIYPVHQMIPLRIIKNYDENGQNAKTVGAEA